MVWVTIGGSDLANISLTADMMILYVVFGQDYQVLQPHPAGAVAAVYSDGQSMRPSHLVLSEERVEAVELFPQ